MTDQGDLFSARASRDEALERVKRNSGPWFDRALAYIATLETWRGTGEDLRILITNAVGSPHHHNAWGSLTRVAMRRGLIIPTGQRVAMRGSKSNARKTDVYTSKN